MKLLVYPWVLTLLLSAPVTADPDPYGLLFTTPEQRARLDNRHLAGTSQSPNDTGSGRGAQPLAVEQLRLNGTLISSGGRKQVWINGRGQLGAHNGQAQEVRLLRSGDVRVDSAGHVLRPGQILDPASGRVRDAYEAQATEKPLTE